MSTPSHLLVQRRFPTYDFIVRTALSRQQAIDTLMFAMSEPSSTSWPSPKPHLSGTVSGGTFTCRPRTSVFGGNAVPAISGEIVPRADGGTDILVRVFEWFVFLLPGVFVLLGIYFAAVADGRSEFLKALAMIGWSVAVGAALYAAEAAFARSIFARIFSVQ
jgi:hypothetical protein